MDAAAALSVSLPRFYAFESRLLEAMIKACEDRPRGRRQRPDHELAQLRQEVERLKRECARKQALVRVVQRTAGLPVPDVRPATKGRRRKRRPVTRALKIAARLRQESADVTPTGNTPGV
jgi:arylamine N-acetyltransferase